MNDNRKGCLGIFFFGAMIVLTIVSLVLGWLAWDFKTGLVLALITCGLLFLVSALTFTKIEKPTALLATLPMILGLIYTALPNPPGPIDDAAVTMGANALTYLLWTRRDENFPRWAILPLLGSGIYDLLGFAIPGHFDEILIDLITGAIVYWKYRNNPGKDKGADEAGES